MMEGDLCIQNFVAGDYEPSLWAAESKTPEEALDLSAEMELLRNLWLRN